MPSERSVPGVPRSLIASRFRGLALILSSLCFLLSGCQSGSDASAKTAPVKTVFGSTTRIEHALVGQVFLLPEGTEKLPNFSALKPEGKIYADTIDVAPRDWQSGFPGVTDRFEWFAIEYKGSIRARKPGSFTFRLVSDDGAKLFIDGKLVIDDDGIHGPRSLTGKVDLDGSPHEMTLQYFQGPRTGIALQLFTMPEGGKEQVFPGNEFELTTPGGNRPQGLIILVVLLATGLIIFLISKRRRNEDSSAAVPELDKDSESTANVEEEL